MQDDECVLNEEEMAAVAGGSFFDRGQTWSSDGKHRLIVTAGYTCDLWRHVDKPQFAKKDIPKTFAALCCANCHFSERDGIVLYCNKRFYDNDPIRDRWTTTSGRF